jgi:hypothetical protein
MHVLLFYYISFVMPLRLSDRKEQLSLRLDGFSLSFILEGLTKIFREYFDIQRTVNRDIL